MNRLAAHIATPPPWPISCNGLCLMRCASLRTRMPTRWSPSAWSGCWLLANSRNEPSMPDGQSNPLSIVHDWLPAYPADHPLSRRLRRALIHQLKRFPQPLDHMAVAVSGGPDSAMLAVELA